MKEHKNQLAAMKDFLDLLETNGIMVWLGGGWGVDFSLGKVTRIHSDIDYAAVSKVISEFSHAITLNNAQKMKFTVDGIRFDICFFVTINGRPFVDLDEQDPYVYPMPENSFQTDTRKELLGIEAYTISWDAQFVSKQGYFHCSNKPLREKDAQDLDIIREHLLTSLKELEELFPGVRKDALGLIPHE